MGKVYVAFTDSREAKNAMEKVHLLRPEWRIFALTAREYIQHSEPSQLVQTSDFEGQLFVSVYYDSRNPNMNHHRVARSLETLAMTFGDMKIFSPLPSKQDHVSEFHLEFFNTRDAENAMTTLNGTSVDVSQSPLSPLMAYFMSDKKKTKLTEYRRIACSKFHFSNRMWRTNHTFLSRAHRHLLRGDSLDTKLRTATMIPGPRVEQTTLPIWS